MRHPYYETARDEQREQFIRDVMAMIAKPSPSAAPAGRRVLRAA